MYAIEICEDLCDENGDIVDISHEDMYGEVIDCPSCGLPKYTMDPSVVAAVFSTLYYSYSEIFDEIISKLKLKQKEEE